MNSKKIKELLIDRNIDNERVERMVKEADELKSFLIKEYPSISLETAGKKEIESYAKMLIKENRNTKKCFIDLRDLAHSINNRDMYIILVELLDGNNVMDVLEKEIRNIYGEEMCRKIFTRKIPLGTSADEKYTYTSEIMEKLQEYITPNVYKQCLVNVRHGMDRGNFEKEREKYQNCGSLDTYLTLKRKERDEELLRLKNENELLYTLSITDEVIDFVKGEMEMEIATGRREGDYVYYTKIPYNPIKYLKETDRRKKCYYACHCFWARESILQGKPVSYEFCHCSLGHAKRLLEGVLECELKGEILESALKGDTRCRFRFTLPKGIA